MACPKCGGVTDTKDSRPILGSIRRRRCCRACKVRFSTVEVIVGTSDLVQKINAAATAARASEVAIQKFLVAVADVSANQGGEER